MFSTFLEEKRKDEAVNACFRDSVENVDRAIVFYTETLGFDLVVRKIGEMKNLWASIKAWNSELWTTSERVKKGLALVLWEKIEKVVQNLRSKNVEFFQKQVSRC